MKTVIFKTKVDKNKNLYFQFRDRLRTTKSKAFTLSAHIKH